ncbi:hypothetical protein ACJJTC_018431 [Scirpophaga incertulas]
MIKHGNDAKVKKILVRNNELKFNKNKETVIPDMGSASNISGQPTINRYELNQPSLCSSEALANYLSEIKLTLPPPVTCGELSSGDLCTKITKKLNFNFDDKIYKNLIELNASNAQVKKKKDKKVASNSTKRDMEPNMEDFFQIDTDKDITPTIPAIKPKFKAIRKIDSEHLHKLFGSFEGS